MTAGRCDYEILFGSSLLEQIDRALSLFLLPFSKKAFEIDTSLVKARFLTLQRSLHPDKFTLKPKEAQEYSERLSSLVNEGYKTLTSPLLRALYLVSKPIAFVFEL